MFWVTNVAVFTDNLYLQILQKKYQLMKNFVDNPMDSIVKNGDNLFKPFNCKELYYDIFV